MARMFLAKAMKPPRQTSFLFIILVSIIVFVVLRFAFQFYSVHYLNSFHKSEEKIDILQNQLQMLNNEQKIRFDKILKRELTKENIEIVLSRYNEDISWIKMYSHITTVYDKYDKENRNETFVSGEMTVIKLPNLGRESSSYLTHIVNNYDKLADVTVFSQAAKPSRGYHGHRHGGGHLLGNSTFHDYVLSDVGHFIFTSALWFPTAAHCIRLGYNRQSISREEGRSMCWDMNADGNKPPTHVESCYSFDYSLIKHISELCKSEDSKICSVPLFWNKYIKLPKPSNDIVFFAQGAIFSATREQIRRRPIEDYKELLTQCSLSSDPSTSFFLEWMWYYLITSNTSPCATKGNEFNWAMLFPYVEHLDFQERVNFGATDLPNAD